MVVVMNMIKKDVGRKNIHTKSTECDNSFYLNAAFLVQTLILDSSGQQTAMILDDISKHEVAVLITGPPTF